MDPSIWTHLFGPVILIKNLIWPGLVRFGLVCSRESFGGLGGQGECGNLCVQTTRQTTDYPYTEAFIFLLFDLEVRGQSGVWHLAGPLCQVDRLVGNTVDGGHRLCPVERLAYTLCLVDRLPDTMFLVYRQDGQTIDGGHTS